MVAKTICEGGGGGGGGGKGKAERWKLPSNQFASWSTHYFIFGRGDFYELTNLDSETNTE